MCRRQGGALAASFSVLTAVCYACTAYVSLCRRDSFSGVLCAATAKNEECCCVLWGRLSLGLHIVTAPFSFRAEGVVRRTSLDVDSSLTSVVFFFDSFLCAMRAPSRSLSLSRARSIERCVQSRLSQDPSRLAHPPQTPSHKHSNI